MACLYVFAAVLITCRPAYAYIDPGTGGLILQLLLAGLAGAAVIVKLYWKKLTALFKRKTAQDPENEEPTRDPDKPPDP